MKKTIVLVFWFFLLNSCFVQKYHISDGNPMPIKPKFKLKGTLKNYQGNFPVDTLAIYLNLRIDTYYGSEKIDTIYHFKRFFPNGQYFGSDYYKKMPTTNDFNQLKNGTIGYYAFIDDELLVETFNQVDGGSYFLSKHKIIGDSLMKYKEKIRCWNCQWTKVNLTYKKITVKNLNGKPDW